MPSICPDVAPHHHVLPGAFPSLPERYGLPAGATTPRRVLWLCLATGGREIQIGAATFVFVFLPESDRNCIQPVLAAYDLTRI